MFAPAPLDPRYVDQRSLSEFAMEDFDANERILSHYWLMRQSDAWQPDDTIVGLTGGLVDNS